MSPAVRALPAAAALVALALAACGPYAELAQKLDVTPRIAGDTWIAAVGPDRSEIRALIVGRAGSDGVAPFSFSAMQFPISRGSTAITLQGTWTEVGSAGTTTLRVAHTYTLPEESSLSILNRRGTWRDDAQRVIGISVARDAGRLVVTGDPRLAATYLPLGQALARLGRTTDRDAACAFQIVNLGIRSSETRIIGFGGPGMTQYQQPENYVGTLAGSLRVSMTGFAHNSTVIQYGAFEDLGGVRVDGPQRTDADSGGNGQMSGVLSFMLVPLDPDGLAGTALTGRIDYGAAGKAIQISGGNAVGGFYATTLDGGGAADVAPATAPTPSVAECLGLP